MGDSRPLAVVCALFFAVYLGNSLWLSLFPNYLLKLGTNSVGIGLTLVVYNASLSVTYLPSGRLSDRLGRRPLIVAGSLLLALSTLLLSLSNRMELVTIGVVGEGIGLGLLVPSGNALVSDVAPGRSIAFAFSIFQIATLLAVVAGSFGAGVLVESIGFQRMFALSATLLVITTIACYAVAPKTSIEKNGSYASAVTDSLKSSVTGTMKILRSNREIALLTGALVIHEIGFFTVNPFVPLFAEKGIHLELSQVGLIMAIWNAGVALAQIPSGRLTDKVGARPMLLAHFALSSLSWVMYTWSWNLGSGVATILFLGAVGALDMPARRTMMVDYTTSEAGKATIIGSLDAVSSTVGMVGPLIGGLAWSAFGYAAPFELAGVVNVFACLPLIALMRRKKTPHPPQS